MRKYREGRAYSDRARGTRSRQLGSRVLRPGGRRHVLRSGATHARHVTTEARRRRAERESSADPEEVRMRTSMLVLATVVGLVVAAEDTQAQHTSCGPPPRADVNYAMAGSTSGRASFSDTFEPQ